MKSPRNRVPSVYGRRAIDRSEEPLVPTPYVDPLRCIMDAVISRRPVVTGIVALDREHQYRSKRAPHLTDEQVREVRDLLAEGMLSVSGIADQYGVSYSVIQYISSGRSRR